VYLWRLIPELDYSHKNDRETSLSGRGQLACALRRPASLIGGEHGEDETRVYWQAP